MFLSASHYRVALKVSFLGPTMNNIFKELWEMGRGRGNYFRYLKSRTLYQLIKRSKQQLNSIHRCNSAPFIFLPGSRLIPASLIFSGYMEKLH